MFRCREMGGYLLQVQLVTPQEIAISYKSDNKFHKKHDGQQLTHNP